MRTFYQSSVVASTFGGQVTLNRPFFSLPFSGSEKTSVTSFVETARAWLIAIGPQVTESPAADVAAAAAKWFRTAASGPSAGEVTAIKRVLSKTATGMKGNIELKLVSGMDAYGSVNVYRGRTDRFVDAHGGWDPGRIKIDRALFEQDRKLASITLIHEATHCFAGTDDHGYIKNDGSGFDDVPGPTKSQCIENADSYAWFVYEVCQGQGIFGGI